MADNNNDTSQAMQAMVASASGLAANIGSKKEMKRAQQYNLETMEKQNQYNIENYKMQRDDAYKREDWLNANSKRIETKALRDAGLNPAWNESSGLASSSSVGAGDIGTPSGSGIVTDGSTSRSIEAFMATMQMQMQQAQVENLKAQSENLQQVSKKTEAETEQILGENKRRIDEDMMSSYSFLRGLHTNDEGKFVDKDGKEIDWSDPDNAMREHTSKRGVEALHAYERFRKDSSTYLSSEVDARLKRLVTNLQLDDEDLLKALANIPNEEYKSMLLENDNKKLQNELEHLSKHIVEKYVLHSDSELVRILGCVLYNYASTH